MGFFQRLFGKGTSNSDRKKPASKDITELPTQADDPIFKVGRPIEQLSDAEVHRELMDLADRLGNTDFVKQMIELGAGERPLLNAERKPVTHLLS